jgi:hypothetical protein
LRKSLLSTTVAVPASASVAPKRPARHNQVPVTWILAAALAFVAGAASADDLARVPAGAKVYIEEGDTVDAGNARDKAKNTDFGIAIAGALRKKQVPVLVVTDPEKADYVIQQTSSVRQDSTGTRIAKMAFGFGGGSGRQFEGSMSVVSRETSAVLFAYNVKKGNYQSAAEAFAKHLYNHMKGEE